MSIKLENVVLASPEQMMFIIQGLRNPMNSHDRIDSKIEPETIGDFGEEYGSVFELGNNDRSLMQRLAKAGTDHRKFMRMMPVYVRITAPLYWWKEFDTYRTGVTPNPMDIEMNSCSTMHKIQEKKFTFEDFSMEHVVCISTLNYIIDELNCWRIRYNQYDEDPEIGKNLNMSKKDIWWQMIQLLPSSYNQTRNAMMNYEVLANIYKSRKNHKLDCWREFCKWIETLPYSELITGKMEDV